MSEHERNFSPEHNQEAQQAAAEKTAELQRRPEVHEDHEAADRVAEKAKVEAKELATSKEHAISKEHTDKSELQGSHIASRTTRDKAYKHTMNTVQSQLTPVERTFSKIMHYPPVEKASDIVGKTIARPTAILAGGVTAFVAVAAVYTIAKFAGFSLQGSETIVAFVVGWLLGMIFDALRALFFAKNR